MKIKELLFKVDLFYISQVFMRGYDRARISPCCIMNTDLKKAYNSISWDFIIELLEGLLFPSRFIDWIRSCICSVSYTLKINGDLQGRIIGRRGLRQGDPISPLLFVIVMEYMTRLLRFQATNSDFKFHPGCAKQKIISLCFAGDLLLFCKATPLVVGRVMEAFHEFSACSGLVANPSKSRL